MLEGLDSIDWSKLGHAYGDASDVPGLLRQLTSDDAEERAKAIHEFYGNIWHQGTVYQATAPAVPFLIELLQSPEVDKDRILILLSHLANGSSYLAVHENLPQHAKERESAEWKEQKRKELIWVGDAFEEVMEGRHGYLKLLAHETPIVRESAAYLLATLVPGDTETAKALWIQLERETDERCRASLLISFGRVAQPEPVNQSLLLNAFLQSSSKMEKLAAAVSLARLFPGDVSEDAAMEIFKAIIDPAPWSQLDSSPWGIQGMELILEDAVRCLKGEAYEFMCDLLRPAAAFAHHPAALNAARAVLAVAFPERLSETATMESLTDFHRSLIQSLAKNKHVWVRSVAGAPAKAPDEAVIFSLRFIDPTLKRLLCEAAREAGTFPKERESFWGAMKRRLGK